MMNDILERVLFGDLLLHGHGECANKNISFSEITTEMVKSSKKAVALSSNTPSKSLFCTRYNLVSLQVMY